MLKIDYTPLVNATKAMLAQKWLIRGELVPCMNFPFKAMKD